MSGQPSERSVTVDRGDSCWRGRFYAMASPCEILCKTEGARQAEDLTELAAAEVWRIEDKFSRYCSDNIVASINSADGAPVAVDTETAHLLDFSTTLFELSEGKFDITSGVLRKVWRFDGGNEIPDPQAVCRVLELVGWQKAKWRDHRLQLEAGMEIDLGGIGKEYAVDRVCTILRNSATVSCLVNLGGDLAVTQRADDRQPWKVGIEGLDSRTELPAKRVNLQVGALATSGDARRFLLRDGKRYSHILDARTGWPIPDAPHSITVAADTCTQAGMLSTLGMLQGKTAEGFLQAQEIRFWCAR